jgi:hypothetical protein
VVSTPPEPRQDRANERCGRSFSIEALIGGGELDFFDAQHPAPLGYPRTGKSDELARLAAV